MHFEVIEQPELPRNWRSSTQPIAILRTGGRYQIRAKAIVYSALSNVHRDARRAHYKLDSVVCVAAGAPAARGSAHVAQASPDAIPAQLTVVARGAFWHDFQI